MSNNTLRLGQYLARAGLCARRDAALFLKEHVVKHNGEIIDRLDYRLNENDILEINGENVAPIPELVILLLNKPVGYVCTHKSQYNQKTIFSLLPKEIGRLFIAGRLDSDSRGLLLLSNHGNFVNKISHPKFGIEKTYIVTTSRPVTEKEKLEMKNGIFEGKDKLRFLDIRDGNVPARYKVILNEGKNREIRRVFKYFNVHVKDLERISIGPYKMGDLPEGKFICLNPKMSKKNIDDIHPSEILEAQIPSFVVSDENTVWSYDYGEIDPEKEKASTHPKKNTRKQKRKLLSPVRRRRSERLAMENDGNHEKTIEKDIEKKTETKKKFAGPKRPSTGFGKRRGPEKKKSFNPVAHKQKTHPRKKVLKRVQNDRVSQVSSSNENPREKNTQQKNRYDNKKTFRSLNMKQGKNQGRKKYGKESMQARGSFLQKSAQKKTPKYKLLIKRRNEGDSDQKDEGFFSE